MLGSRAVEGGRKSGGASVVTAVIAATVECSLLRRFIALTVRYNCAEPEIGIFFRQKAMWKVEEDEILIDFVKNNESLYNVKSKEYRNTQLKQNLWSNAGTILQKSGGFIVSSKSFYIALHSSG